MSKLVDATITCPQCGQDYPVKLFRTLWGEHESLRAKVMNDDVNVCSCPHCHYSFKAPYPFMYVDVNVGFAVWWEPTHDAGIDSDAVSYARMFGVNSFYAKAPRIEDWNEFKNTIMKYYSGELVGGKIEKMDLSTLRKTSQTKGKGCMLTFLFIIVFGFCLSAL